MVLPFMNIIAPPRPGEIEKSHPKRSWKRVVIGIVLIAVAMLLYWGTFYGNWFREGPATTEAVLETIQPDEIAVVTTIPTPTTPPTTEPVVVPPSVTTTSTTTTTMEPTTTTVVYEDGVQGSCLLLEERWCREGILVEWTREGYDSRGSGTVTTIRSVLAFDLPPGVPIFAPLDGRVLYQGTGGAYAPSSLGFQSREWGLRAVLIMTPESPLEGGDFVSVEAGELLGFVSEFSAVTGRDEMKPTGDYNLVVEPAPGTELDRLYSEAREDGFDEEELVEMFRKQQEEYRARFWGLFGIEPQPGPILVEQGSP